MDDKFLEYLFVTGELDRETYGVNDMIGEYNSMFPNNPLPRSFYDLSVDEEISLLSEALDNGTPIIEKQKRF